MPYSEFVMGSAETDVNTGLNQATLGVALFLMLVLQRCTVQQHHDPLTNTPDSLYFCLVWYRGSLQENSVI